MKKALYASILTIMLLTATPAYVFKPVAAQEEEVEKLPFLICAYVPQDWNTTDKYTFLKPFYFNESGKYYFVMGSIEYGPIGVICHVNLIFWSLGSKYAPSKDVLKKALMNGEGVIFIADGAPTEEIREILSEAGITVNIKNGEKPPSYIGPILLELKKAVDDPLLEGITEVDVYAWKGGAFIESIEGQFVRKIGEIGPSEIYQAFPYGTRMIIITNAAGFGDRGDTIELFRRLLLWVGYTYPSRPGSWKLTEYYKRVLIYAINVIDRLNESLLSCQAEIENMTAEKEDLIDQIEELEQKLEECQASLNATGAETSRIEELKKTIETLQSQVSRLNKELESKNGEIERLNSQLANMRSELQKASSEKDRLSNLLKGVTLGLPAAVAGIPITAVFIAVIIALAAFSAILLVGGYRPKIPRKR